MKIGIDARFLSHPQLGGFKTYTVNLISALSQIDYENQYIIYLDRTPTEGVLPQSKNFIYKIVPATLPVVGMPFREQLILNRVLARDKPDVVHFLCNTAPVRLPENSIISLLDVIQIKSPQSFPFAKGITNIKRWAITNYSKWTILKTAQNAKRLITLSLYEKDQIVKYLAVDPKSISVTYFGVNSIFSRVDPRIRDKRRPEILPGLGVNRKFIMGVGYEPRKNIPLLIEAFAQLAPIYLDLDLVIVAAERERRLFFSQMAANLNLENRIAVLAALQPNDLAILYNLAEVFVFPSERESFGAPPLEAVACGTPTVAMNMTSLPEILQDGALLIDGKNVDTWSKAIERALTDRVLREDLINRGLKRAAELTWQQCARDTVDVYRAVADESKYAVENIQRVD